ncbi:MAG: DUF1801 domain-containing protein [Pseudomonadota bacterium]
MAELKTRQNAADVKSFLKGVKDPKRREDALAMLDIMGELTGETPRMWGSSIVGFGKYHYVYESGREGDWMATGFSPRKQALTLYIMSGFSGEDGLMEKLGTFKTGKSCLYVKRLEDVHLPTLKKLITKSYRHIKKKYASTAS